MMTIDKAIAHAKEKAKEQKSKYDNCPTRLRYACEMCFHTPKCDEDAKEHEQLAELNDASFLAGHSTEHTNLLREGGLNNGSSRH